MSVVRHRVNSMPDANSTKFITFPDILTVGFSGVISLVVLEILPDGFLAGVPFLKASISFSLLAVFGFSLIRYFRLGTLEYFRLPQKTTSTIVAIGFVVVLTIPPIFSVERESKSPLPSLLGVLFVFSVGLGEEIFSRGFHFGLLEKYSKYLALTVSSSIFGLMHLNRYFGDDWDAWKAFSHVLAAFGFGLLACALMITTRSIWVAVIFHTLANWDMAFHKVGQPISQDNVSEDLLGRILIPVVQLIAHGILACLILWTSSGCRTPQKVHRLVVSLKLVDSDR